MEDTFLGMHQHFILSLSLRAADYEQNHQGLTSLFVQNFLQFVETVQFFIFAAFRVREYSAIKYFPGLVMSLFPFKLADGVWHRERGESFKPEK